MTINYPLFSLLLFAAVPLTASIVSYHEPTVSDGVVRQNYPFSDAAAEWQPNTDIRPDWRIPERTLPTRDVPVIGYSVSEFGAVGDGTTDDTHAFHFALNHMAAAGGGTVWVPAGRYVIRGTLDIPLNVELRGEWRSPEAGPVAGTVLMAYAGRGEAEGEPFIEMHSNCAVTNLSIWYPEQSAAEPAPYPWTIVQRPMDLFKPFATIQNVTLVNSWQGIRIGLAQKGSNNWFIRQVFGTPLKAGVDLDMNIDTGRIYDVSFSPRYWEESGLPGAPEPRARKQESRDILRIRGSGFTPRFQRPQCGITAVNRGIKPLPLSAFLVAPEPRGSFREWLRSNGTAFRLRRQDFAHWGPMRAEGYRTGLHGSFSQIDEMEERMRQYGSAHFQGHFYRVHLTDCRVAARIEGMHEAGVIFTDCTLEGSEQAVLIPETERFGVQLNGCRIKGGLANLGRSPLNLLHTRIEGAVEHHGEALSIAGGLIRAAEGADLQLGQGAGPVTLAGAPAKPSALRIEGAKAVHRDPQPIAASALPGLELDLTPPSWREPAREHLQVVEPGGDASTIAAALANAAADGGGIVFLPPGAYPVAEPLEVPGGVELRGALAVPHHLVRAPTVLLAGRRDPDAAPLLTVSGRAGVRGLGFFFPWQDWRSPVDQPFVLKGEGENLYLESLTAGATTHLLDLASARCDGHWVDALSANVLHEAIMLGGGSRGGRVFNSHFISHFWSLLHSNWTPAALREHWRTDPEKLPRMQWQDLEAGKAFIQTLIGSVEGFRLGDVRDQTLFHNFIYGCRSGLVTRREEGRAPAARVFHHGSDASIQGADLDAVGEDGLYLINLMSYNVDGERAVGLHAELDEASGPVFVESFQTTGWSNRVFDRHSGDVRINGGLFLDTAKSGFRSSADEPVLTGGYFSMPRELFSVDAGEVAASSRVSVFRYRPFAAGQSDSGFDASGNVFLSPKPQRP